MERLGIKQGDLLAPSLQVGGSHFIYRMVRIQLSDIAYIVENLQLT